jgi:ribosomal-protein-alanine N-acetyltransferase
MADRDLPAVIAVEDRIYEFPWTEGNFRDALRSGYDAVLVEFGGSLVGYRVMMYGPGEAHLLNLSIAAEWQRRGFGRQLLLACIHDARQADAQTLFLEVRPSNAAGIALYESTGFSRIGVRRGYYPAVGGREDAWVMSRPL